MRRIIVEVVRAQGLTLLMRRVSVPSSALRFRCFPLFHVYHGGPVSASMSVQSKVKRKSASV